MKTAAFPEENQGGVPPGEGGAGARQGNCKDPPTLGLLLGHGQLRMWRLFSKIDVLTTVYRFS